MKSLSTLFILLMLGALSSANAQLVVIANKDMNTDELTRKKVIDIYMGRYSLLSSGEVAIPLDHRADSNARSVFYTKLVGKDVSEINAYWARLLFSGRARPPRVVKTEKEVVETVIKSSSVIGYIDSSELTDQVKVILRVE